VVTGVREDGYRDLLGARVMDCENGEFWSGLFENLTERGVGHRQKVFDHARGMIRQGDRAQPNYSIY